MSESIVKHGNMMVIGDLGVLITGPPKIGKSEISLALIDRGHCFISDDATELRREGDKLVANCPKVINQFMQIDHIGLINIQKLFGENACMEKHAVDIRIELQNPDGISAITQPLQPEIKPFNLLGIQIPSYSLPILAGKQLPLLIEVIARNAQIEKAGYDALKDLQARQRKAINKETGCKQKN